MALKDMSLLTGATIAASGGTALGFAANGVSIPNGLQLIVPGDADYQTRRSLTAKYRPSVVDPKTGSYGKDKKSITLVKPIVLTDGRVVFNTLRIEREMHPSVSAADCTDFNKIGAQLLTDSDTDGFWANGSLS